MRVDRADARRMRVRLVRLRDDCDPCVFIRRGRKPTQQNYDKCTYERWADSEREHVVDLDELRVDTYFLGVWNTPIFGQHDAAFTIQCTIEYAEPEVSWVDETERFALGLRSLAPSFQQLETEIGAHAQACSASIEAVRQALVKAAESACEPGIEIAKELGLSEREVNRRRLPRQQERWIFRPPLGRGGGDDDDDGGLFGAMEASP